jgi:hypothetical protein
VLFEQAFQDGVSCLRDIFFAAGGLRRLAAALRFEAGASRFIVSS